MMTFFIGASAVSLIIAAVFVVFGIVSWMEETGVLPAIQWLCGAGCLVGGFILVSYYVGSFVITLLPA